MKIFQSYDHKCTATFFNETQCRFASTMFLWTIHWKTDISDQSFSQHFTENSEPITENSTNPWPAEATIDQSTRVMLKDANNAYISYTGN